MTGKIASVAILVCAALAGIALYYLQVYHFYEEIPATGHGDVRMTHQSTGVPEPVLADGFQAIDAESSPIRYRACFETSVPLEELSASYERYDGAAPRNAPGWFDCFDADAIGADIEAGTAIVFVGQRNFEFGIDRVVAVTEAGRGYVWHEINECGDKAYDGSPLGKDCPAR